MDLRARLIDDAVAAAEAEVCIAWWHDRAKRLRALADVIGGRLGSGNYLDDAGQLDEMCREAGFMLVDAPKKDPAT